MQGRAFHDCFNDLSIELFEFKAQDGDALFTVRERSLKHE